MVMEGDGHYGPTESESWFNNFTVSEAETKQAAIRLQTIKLTFIIKIKQIRIKYDLFLV